VYWNNLAAFPFAELANMTRKTNTSEDLVVKALQ
jgi:hypothetical protein